MNKDVTQPLAIEKILETTNVAELLNEEDLKIISSKVREGYDRDLDSRKPWEEDLTKWSKLAMQVSEERTYPWPNAANIKYPLLSTAAMQFAARAYPTLVPSDGKVVKCQVIGKDPTGEKTNRAERVSTHMSYQVMYQMCGWEEDMDKLLLALPIAGTAFKKTYWDAGKQQNVSKLIFPKLLVVNYYAKSLEDAERLTEIVYLSKRQVKERQNKKIYLDVELPDPSSKIDEDETHQRYSSVDDDTAPYTILEQHTYLDLDDDGYAEPYIVTMDYDSETILRVVPRYNADMVMVDEKNKVISIVSKHYYTKYSFIPNPDGGFYDIGFGRLLGPLNEAANTLINQLTDAGSLSNLQAGFIGKGLRIRMGETRFSPGEWKAVNAVGDDLKKQIFPMPVREPSEVLFKLLDLLLKSGKELASVAEIFVGKMPGQNTPATTTMATIEQGMKVFTAVYKRVYRSLTSEFKKIYLLNREYMNPEEYISILDDNAQQQDYEASEDDIIPGADPTAVSTQEKQAKVKSLLELLQLGTIDPMAVTKMYLEAHDIPNPEQMMKQPSPPPPDPKMEAMRAKAQLDQQKAQTDMAIAQQKAQMEGKSKEQEMAIKQQLAATTLRMKQMEALLTSRKAQAELAANSQTHQQQLVHTQQKGQQDLAMKAAQHHQKMKQQPKKET